MAREIGSRARSAVRHARVWLWRFKRSPERRDRAAAFATFAFIGVFTLGSIDAVITGGADFDSGDAYAMDYSSERVAAPTLAAAPVVEPQASAETVKAVAVEEIDYSFTTEELLGGPEETAFDDVVLEDLAERDGKAEASAPVADVNPKAAAL